MSSFPELSSLFATMASSLQNLDAMNGNDDPNLALSISNLNRSLNLSETPGVRVLDAALSLMCYTGPQVYDSVIEYTGRTIATVLTSSIGCKLFRINEEEVLRVGGSISSRDCVKIVEACAEEFQDTYIRYCKEALGVSASSKVQTCKEFSILRNLLFRRIPLGILIGYCNHLTPAGCELFLHYAATGNVSQFAEMQNSGLKLRRQKCDLQEGSVPLTENYTRTEAIAGTRVAFEIIDVTETLSHSIETEENGLDLICQVKSKTGNYLFKCIKRLLQLKIDEDDGLQMRSDLLTRLIRWRCQGKDVFLKNKDLNDLVDAFSFSLPCL
ncbi:Hypothetical predicted protein [Olea europaea subsp. europaea]|uniref:Uncharacterized protein n=1 Tax=Olea europaea subsp. europaea TaxID=158383 RepID=A0A8S0UC60_OLEEU|nr:Hypothetical predicted protein [Olea europaea subsp. europaea]